MQFGKFHRIAQPGYNCVCCLLGEEFKSTAFHVLLHCTLVLPSTCKDMMPSPRSKAHALSTFDVATGESVAGSLSLRVQQLDVRCETKTRDNVGTCVHMHRMLQNV